MAEQIAKDRIADTMIGLGAGMAIVAPLLLLVEAAEWLVTGQWPGWSIEDGLLLFGVEKPLAFFSLTQFSLDLLVSLPLALGLYVAGQGIFIFGLGMDQD